MGAIGIIAKILPLALQVIPFIERLIGKGEGDKKRAAAIKLIVPVIQAIESASGKELVDEEALAEAAGNLVDGIVAVMNLFGILNGEDTPDV